MDSKLSLQNQQFLTDAIVARDYPSRTDAINAAVELLRHEREALLQELDKGRAELQRNEGRPLDIEAVKREGRPPCSFSASSVPPW